MKDARCYFLSKDEADKVAEVFFNPKTHGVKAPAVGQTALRLAEMAGIEVSCRNESSRFRDGRHFPRQSMGKRKAVLHSSVCIRHRHSRRSFRHLRKAGISKAAQDILQLCIVNPIDR